MTESEKKEAEIVEVEKKEESSIPLSKEVFTEMNEKAMILENVHKKLGTLVVQQGILTDHALSMRKELGELSLDAMKKAGIPEGKTEEYMVDINKGVIVLRP
ncbi:MAG TPA: hypothetical protein VMZ91_04955 [Candidatus Paceibacterota bacterium]|nr:hypothetical protein [Candidatus Paceibacterota bacterium]